MFKFTRFMSLFAVAAGLLTMLNPPAVQAQSPADQLYVSEMGVAYANVGGPKRRPIAQVSIVDGNGLPINGALVVGNWSGCFKQNNDSAFTQTYFYFDSQADGRAEIWADKSYSCWGAKQPHCYFTFTITGVLKDGMTYMPVNGYGTSWSRIQCQ